jgi:hypothetical protein
LKSAASILGLEQWQLNNASYNGVSFTIFDSAVNKFNPLSALTGSHVNQFMNTLSPVNNISNFPSDPNGLLNYDTKIALNRINDTLSRKLSIYRLPGYNGYVLQDQGFDGSKHTATGLFVGSDYLTAFDNFLIAATNDENAQGAQNILVHPIHGELDECYITNINVTFASDKWQALIFEFTFVCAQGLLSVTEHSAQSALSKIASVINEVMETINGIGTSISDVQLAMGLMTNITSAGKDNYDGGKNSIPVPIPQPSFGQSSNLTANSSNSMIPTTPLNVISPYANITKQPIYYLKFTDKLNLMTSLNNSYGTLSNSVLLIYNKLSPFGYVNYDLANIPIDYTQLPPLFKYATIVGANEVDTLLQYYSNEISSIVKQYIDNGIDTIFADHIYNFHNSITQLSNLCKVLLSTIDGTYITYTTPYVMSIRQVCFQNGLDFNNSEQIMSIIIANQQLLMSLNVIPSGTVLTLPKVI